MSPVHPVSVATTMEKGLVHVVDDDEATRRGLATALQLNGWRTREFDGAFACLAMLDDERPSCIVSDLQMPEGSGRDLAQALQRRADPPPLIIITGAEPAHADVQAVYRRGLPILFKPLALDELLALLDAAARPFAV